MDMARPRLSFLSQLTMAFIAPGTNDHDPTPGRVRVFTYKGAEWEQMGEPIVNWDKNDKRGRAMSMSRDGKVVAVGSPQLEGTGHTRIYAWDDAAEAWLQRGEAIPGGGSFHETGTNVALNTLGDIVAVGAPMNSDKGKTAGRVRIYHWDEERVKDGVPAPAWVLKGQHDHDRRAAVQVEAGLRRRLRERRHPAGAGHGGRGRRRERAGRRGGGGGGRRGRHDAEAHRAHELRRRRVAAHRARLERRRRRREAVLRPAYLGQAARRGQAQDHGQREGARPGRLQMHVPGRHHRGAGQPLRGAAAEASVKGTRAAGISAAPARQAP